MDKEHIDQYLNAGKVLTPLNNAKVPITLEWRSSPLPKSKIYGHWGNLGWVLGDTDLVVDIDPKNGGDLGFMGLVPTVTTPSGGVHIYFSIPQGTKCYKSRPKVAKGIDFLTQGCQCVIAGSNIEGVRYSWEEEWAGFQQSPAPQELVEMIRRRPSSRKVVQEEESSQSSVRHMRKFIAGLDPDLGYGDWIKVGMALHNWDATNEGFDVWNVWSSKGSKYKAEEMNSHWSSFRDQGGVTIASLSHIVKSQAGKVVKKPEASLSTLIEKKIKPSDKQGLLEEVDNSWCDNWVYVISHAAFINLGTLEFYKTEGFNVTNSKHVPSRSKGGRKETAMNYVINRSLIDAVGTIAYLPHHPAGVLSIAGKKVVNTFRHGSVPKLAEKFTDEGKGAVECIIQHIKILCNTEENSKIFIQWLAHQIQFPGKRILWAPVVQSIQGVGKSFIGTLLRSMLGYENIGVVTYKQLVSDFNGWATGKLVNIMEDIHVKGHNRFEAMNSVKCCITDTMIPINKKNINAYLTWNVTNYICFTNYKDSLPIENDDRRWWVIFVDHIRSMEDIEKISGKKREDYFNTLHESLEKYGPEISKWFHNYTISKEFLNMKVAPQTVYKDAMISTENACVKGLEEAKAMIVEGGSYYNSQVISTADLFRDLEDDAETPLLLNSTEKNYIMKRLGYVAHGRMKIAKKTRNMWVKTPMSNKKILESIGSDLDHCYNEITEL